MTEREYNQCVNQYADNVYRFIVKNLRHEEDARDIVQTAFEKLWRNREAVETEKSKSYLFTVAYNQMIDHIRKNKRIQLKEDFSEDGRAQHTNTGNLKKTLMDALNRLNETQKSLVMLKDYEGYSYEEIGVIMSLTRAR
jgi:RNA polymerase sigma factor (sigma-70 family)